MIIKYADGHDRMLTDMIGLDAPNGHTILPCPVVKECALGGDEGGVFGSCFTAHMLSPTYLRAAADRIREEGGEGSGSGRRPLAYDSHLAPVPTG